MWGGLAATLNWKASIPPDSQAAIAAVKATGRLAGLGRRTRAKEWRVKGMAVGAWGARNGTMSGRSYGKREWAIEEVTAAERKWPNGLAVEKSSTAEVGTRSEGPRYSYESWGGGLPG